MALSGSGYELVVGGLPTDSASTVYRELTDLSVTITESSVGTWNCAVPRDTALADRVLDDIYLYYDGELLFGGRLEAVESSYTDSTTSLSGRGVAVRLKTQTDVITYSSTNVHDAIVDYWENHTAFEPIVLPPNRDILDENYNTTGEHGILWGEFGFLDDEPSERYGTITDNQLTTERVNHTVDAATSVPSITVSGATDTSNSSYSTGTGVRIDGGGTSSGSLTWTTNFDYQNTDPGLHVRLASSTTSATLHFSIDGTETHSWDLSSQQLSHQWLSVFTDSSLTSVNGAPSSVSGDTSVEVSIAGLGSNEWVDIDAISLVNESAGVYTLPDSLTSEGVYAGPEWHPTDTRIEAYRSSSSYDNVTTSQSTKTIEALVETAEPTGELLFGMRNVTTGTVQTQTISHSTPRTRHFVRFEFGSSGSEFAPIVELDGLTPDSRTQSGETIRQGVSRVELIGPDTSKYVPIESNEFTGSKFDILAEVHDLGSYEFAVTDYEHLRVESFPSDTVRSEPNWTITDSTRKLDYSDYANKVTVDGKTQSDGTYNTATVSDQDEIDAIGEPIGKYEKNTDVETQAEVDARAQRLLDKSISAKDESGSLSIVPQELDVGFTYPISNWSRAFTDGSRIGANALYFREGKSDVVETDLDNVYEHKNYAYTFEFLVYPELIKSLDADEYRTLFAVNEESYDFDIVRLYGDGSVGVAYYGDEVRSESGLLNEAETQRLSIRWGFAFDDVVFYIDGMEVSRIPNSIVTSFTIDEVNLKIGKTIEATGNGYDYIGGLDDVRLWNHWKNDSQNTVRTQAEIRAEAYEDLTQQPDVDLEDLVVYLRFDDHSTPTKAWNDGNPYTQTANPWAISGPVYDARYGSLEEIWYQLGDDGSMDLRFDVGDRIGSIFAGLQQAVNRNTKYL